MRIALAGSIFMLTTARAVIGPARSPETHDLKLLQANEAAKLAVREAVDFLVNQKGIPRDDAYILCSIGVDLHVTQLVDGTKGVHAMIPKSIFAR